MQEQIIITWVVPYQSSEYGDIITQKVRIREIKNCKDYLQASQLMEKLAITVRDFYESEDQADESHN